VPPASCKEVITQEIGRACIKQLIMANLLHALSGPHICRIARQAGLHADVAARISQHDFMPGGALASYALDLQLWWVPD
jgi:hypothetical protein